MNAAWMLYVLLVGVLMALAAGSVAAATRAVGRPTRWVWAGALASVVVLAAVVTSTPGAPATGRARRKWRMRVRRPSSDREPLGALSRDRALSSRSSATRRR